MKQTYLYPIIIEPCEEGGFFAKCPALQGVHAEGDTYAETLENIESVIQAVLEEEKPSENLRAFTMSGSFPAFQVTLPIAR